MPSYDAGYRDGFREGYDFALQLRGLPSLKGIREERARAEPTPKRKKAGKAAKGMGRAMREANQRLRTKSGKLRKGKTQADVARLAHKIRRQKYE